VIVPTKYFSTPTTLFKELGISTVIWANHNLRASVSAMQNTCHQIMSEESLVNIEGKVSKSHSSFTFSITQFCTVRYITDWLRPLHRMGQHYIHVPIHIIFCHFPWFVIILTGNHSKRGLMPQPSKHNDAMQTHQSVTHMLYYIT